MRGPILLFLLLLGVTTSYAQGTFRGKVTDPNGEAVMEVKILLLENKAVITKTDLDGNFTLNIPDNALYKVRFTHYAHDTLIESIQIKDKEVLVKNITINPRNTTKNEKQITVGIKQVKANDYYMEKIKLNSATTIDYISSETMKKTGDPNVTAAVARVSGVSTNGGLITVRGIGDRYVKTTLNGSRIPTLDPLTNNIKLDIIPTSLVDNVIITKSASPNLPGDWAGAYISVETKDFPDKLSVNIESSFGYNAQTTFKDFITSDRSKTDWLGFDGGLRSRKGNEDFSQPILTPTSYQEMVALGLGQYFSQQGINGWVDGSPESNTYMRLGLVQLGLLQANNINSDVSYQQALAIYNQQYKPQAYSILNPNGTDFNNGFSNNWNSIYRKAPIAFTQNISVGDQVKLFGKQLGFFVGFRYGNSVRFDPNGISQRILNESLGYAIDYKDSARISKETNSWSALINLAYKLNDNNKISLLYMPNVFGSNDVARFSNMELDAGQELKIRNSIFYEERNQKITQFQSKHFLPKLGLKIESNVSYTRGKSKAPDFKLMQYSYNMINGQIDAYEFSPTAGEGIRRYFRYLNENIFDSRLQFEKPFSKESKLSRSIKFGGSFQQETRKSLLEEYYLAKGNAFNPNLQNEDINEYLNPDQFIMQNGQIGYYYLQTIWPRNNSFGIGKIASSFLMIDFEVNNKIRLAGGVRAESTDIFTDVLEYHRNNYEYNDVRRENFEGFPFINAASLKQVNYLPSGSLIVKIKNDTISQSNLRFNLSQTIARPSFRELYDGVIYDYEFRTLIFGNSNLKPVQITNYDMRFENYWKNGDNLSASIFYKDFRNHIEMGFEVDGITWQNVEKSNVKGVEIEFKKTISKSFDIRSNVTFVKSLSQFVLKQLSVYQGIKYYTPIDTINRVMFGQAPYIVNVISSYSNQKMGLNVSISYNLQGPRLVISSAIQGTADVYEMPRHLIDFKLTKAIKEHFTLSLTVRDLLNSPVQRQYKTSNEFQTYDYFRYGTNFQLGIIYKL